MKYTLLVQEPGTSFKSKVSGVMLKTSHRRVEIKDESGKTVADFVRRNKSQPTARHTDEVAFARRVLHLINQ